MKQPPPILSSLRTLAHRVSTCILEGSRAVQGVVFPRNCPGCMTPVPHPQVICESCAARLPRIQMPICRRCGTPLPEFWRVRVCPDCRSSRSPLFRVRTCFYYEGLVRQMIRDAKFHRHARLLKYFSGEIYVMARAEFLSSIEAIIPVPLHRAREWERTFNQSELIARQISSWCGIPVWSGLRRVQSTSAQSGLSGVARRRNLRDAFAVNLPGAVPRRVLLVDDVITTGATLEACARILRRNGARRVCAVAAARAVLRKNDVRPLDSRV